MNLETSHLFQEIQQQPAVLAQFLSQARPAVQALCQAIQQHQINYVVIAARGTSDNAGRYAQYVLGSRNGLMVALAAPSLFTLYQRPPRFGKALVLGISQSGKSPDIVAVLAEARRQGVLTAAITNIPNSDLAQQADVLIDLNTGREEAVAATKSYTAELAAIALLSATLSSDPQDLADLEQIPQAVAQTLTMNESIAQLAPRYRYMERAVVIGRGYNYATAFEMALKLKELTYTIIEPYSSADFLHGPLALIEPGFPVVVVAPAGALQSEMATFIQTLNQRQAEIICLSDVAQLYDQARIPLPLPATVPEWLSPITAIIPGQLLAMHLAHTRDYNVDAPRNLRKVTETR